MKNKLDFYEVVTIRSMESEHKRINCKEGVVMGMAQDDIGKWVYAVDIDEDGWSIEEKHLVSTGKFSSRDQFYSGETIRVIVNDKGEGEIKKDN